MAREIIKIEEGDLKIQVPKDFESVSRARRILEAYLMEFEEQKDIEEELEDEEEKIENMDDLIQQLVEEQGDDEVNISISEPEQIFEPKKIPVIEEQKKVEIKPSEENYDVCPLCSGKLKKKKIKRVGNEIRQKVICKNRKCKFERDFVFSL